MSVPSVARGHRARVKTRHAHLLDYRSLQLAPTTAEDVERAKPKVEEDEVHAPKDADNDAVAKFAHLVEV